MTDLVGARARMIEATLWALDGSGESEFTVEQIAAAAHVGKQTIYQHFGDRNGLIVAAQAERYRRQILTGLDVLVDGVMDCVTADEYERLLITVASVATRSGDERRRLRIQALGSAAVRPSLQSEIGEAHRAAIAGLAKVYNFGQRRGWLSTTFSASTFSALWFAMITGHHVSESYADEADREAINTATVDAISLMLFGKTFPKLNNADYVARALAAQGSEQSTAEPAATDANPNDSESSTES